MTTIEEAPARRLPLERAANFRDLGGYRTTAGATTGWGRIFRADGLHELTEADLARLGRLPLRTACDLRTAHEAARYPNRFRDDPAVAYHHLPMSLPADDDPIMRATGLEHYRRLYPYMVEHSGAAFRAIFSHLADPAAYPYVFHCTAGKDRTGVVAAVILLAAGVDRETVLADYTATGAHLDDLRQRLDRYLRDRGLDPATFVLDVYPEALVAAIDHVETNYGSASYFLLEQGVPEADLAVFRSLFLDGA